MVKSILVVSEPVVKPEDVFEDDPVDEVVVDNGTSAPMSEESITIEIERSLAEVNGTDMASVVGIELPDDTRVDAPEEAEKSLEPMIPTDQMICREEPTA